MKQVAGIDFENLLKNKQKYNLLWCEPWPSLDEKWEDTCADVTLRASVDHCINMQRLRIKKIGCPSINDLQLLQDFVVINWAWVVEI
jgi:hypothetical protein